MRNLTAYLIVALVGTFMWLAPHASAAQTNNLRLVCSSSHQVERQISADWQAGNRATRIQPGCGLYYAEDVFTRHFLRNVPTLSGECATLIEVRAWNDERWRWETGYSYQWSGYLFPAYECLLGYRPPPQRYVPPPRYYPPHRPAPPVHPWWK